MAFQSAGYGIAVHFALVEAKLLNRRELRKGRLDGSSAAHYIASYA